MAHNNNTCLIKHHPGLPTASLGSYSCLVCTMAVLDLPQSTSVHYCTLWPFWAFGSRVRLTTATLGSSWPPYMHYNHDVVTLGPLCMATLGSSPPSWTYHSHLWPTTVILVSLNVTLGSPLPVQVHHDHPVPTQSHCAYNGCHGLSTAILDPVLSNNMSLPLSPLAHDCHSGLTMVTTVLWTYSNHHWDLHSCNVHGHYMSIWWCHFMNSFTLIFATIKGYSTHDPCWWWSAKDDPWWHWLGRDDLW